MLSKYQGRGGCLMLLAKIRCVVSNSVTEPLFFYWSSRASREGRLQELDRIIRQCPREDMLAWFSVRMFKEACLRNRLQTVRVTNKKH